MPAPFPRPRRSGASGCVSTARAPGRSRRSGCQRRAPVARHPAPSPSPRGTFREGVETAVIGEVTPRVGLRRYFESVFLSRDGPTSALRPRLPERPLHHRGGSSSRGHGSHLGRPRLALHGNRRRYWITERPEVTRYSVRFTGVATTVIDSSCGACACSVVALPAPSGSSFTADEALGQLLSVVFDLTAPSVV